MSSPGDILWQAIQQVNCERAGLLAAAAKPRPASLHARVARLEAQGERRLLSKRQAARRLGIDRATTLQRLIDAKQVRTVRVGARVRIPAEELERISREGINDVAPRAPQPKPAPRRAGDAIRALKLA